MEVILLEKLRNLGNIGEQVAVAAGYARNYLIPYGKAVKANRANLEKFSKMRAELEGKAAAALKLAEERAAKFKESVITVPAKATEEGKLFGSVTATNVAQLLQEQGFAIQKKEINMPQGVIRQVGEYEVELLLHADVTAKLKINVVATQSS